jgi:hypothetical protein
MRLVNSRGSTLIPPLGRLLTRPVLRPEEGMDHGGFARVGPFLR